MANEKVITWDVTKLERFRSAYKKANASSVETFEFEGNLFVVTYAKYLIEYLEIEFKKK